MKALSAIKQRNSLYWNVVVLEQEAESLRRERIHLEHKSQERQLTLWETARMREIFDETEHIMREIASVAKVQRVVLN